MSTEFPSKSGINREWHVLNADDVVLGKLAKGNCRRLSSEEKRSLDRAMNTLRTRPVINVLH